jgi:hypothetical protein
LCKIIAEIRKGVDIERVGVKVFWPLERFRSLLKILLVTGKQWPRKIQ